MNLLSLLYITEAQAIEMGATHEGTLYGVPAWFIGDGDNEETECHAVTKVPALLFWPLLMDFLVDLHVSMLQLENFHAPIYPKRKLTK